MVLLNGQSLAYRRDYSKYLIDLFRRKSRFFQNLDGVLSVSWSMAYYLKRCLTECNGPANGKIASFAWMVREAEKTHSLDVRILGEIL